ncbi:alpha/beta fold hydrolase [Naumannella cuiyingiana]|uniref:Pimeloyl-ACP methyl ester carboxylesterase n=1 Tax=Naumannella cuiyingiana TaxID=1347891 RepID=A0A7Z0IKB9_9ACTN|nr:alpha/beta hydrolase [Naumannella cuiyingiana]NYI70353.1 pimeloyl-ACP methyl ester carboxylesterase [Naumannella cuiyingiana]
MSEGSRSAGRGAVRGATDAARRGLAAGHRVPGVAPRSAAEWVHRLAGGPRPARAYPTPGASLTAGGIAKGVGIAAGVTALAVGAVAAGLEVQSRVLARRLRDVDRETADLFALHSEGRELTTPDGVRLHVEVVEAPDAPDDLTVVWVHGYALSMDNWYFQRKAFAGQFRSVFYDQRSHGRSGHSAPELARVPQLGADLEQVIDEVVGDAPMVLVGHSMGGMTIMNLARRRPEWFGEHARVRGVALLNTSSGAMGRHSIVPGIPGTLFSRLAPPVLTTLNRLPGLVGHVRRRSGDVSFVVARRLSFADRNVSAKKVEFLNEMLQATPLDVVADFYPTFATLDESGSFAALARTDLLIIGGTDDLITPYSHTETLIESLPGAELLRLTETGHMSMIERDEQVNAALAGLFGRVRAASG